MSFPSLNSRQTITATAILLATMCLLVWALLFVSLPAQADPTITEKQDEVDRLRSEIAGINESATQAVERYNQANVELENTRLQLVANEEALAQAIADLAESQGILEKRVDRIYRQGSTGFIEVLFNTSSINEFLSQYDMLGRIGEQDKEVVEHVFALKTEVENARVELEQTQQKQQELVDTLAAEKNEIESSLAEREAVLAGAEAEVAQMLAAEQQQQQEQAAAASSGQVAAQPTGDASAASPYVDDPASLPAPPPPSSGGAVSIASNYLGVPYVWGGASPSGFDCSGLVMYVFAQMGVSLPHSAAAQYYAGTPVSYSQLAPGDLVFFGQPIYHVGIYAGGGSMIHAPYPGASVSYTSVSALGSYSGACRI